jgi:ABC-2 type transport system permease protein
MRSKTSFSETTPAAGYGLINMTMLKKNITRFWPLWGAYLVVWLLILPISYGNSFLNGAGDANSVARMAGDIYDLAGVGGTIIGGICGILSAMAVFSYLTSSRAVGMMHSLPLRRGALFTTNYLSGYLFMLVPNILVFFVTLAVYSAYGLAGFFVPMCVWLVTVCVLCFFFYSFAVLCAMLTGHILILPAVYVILNGVIIISKFLVRKVFGMLVLGYNGDMSATKLDFLSPFYYLASFRNWDAGWRDNTGVLHPNFGGWWPVLGYGLAAVAIVGIAFAIYRRRHSESAGDVVAVPVLKPVFKYCMGFGLVITLGLLLTTIFKGRAYGASLSLIMFLCMLVSAFLGYFAAEMLIHKSLRVFKRGWKGFIIFCAVFAALFCCVEFDMSGFETHIPATADISGVDVYSPSIRNYSAHLFEDEAGIEAVRSMHEVLTKHKRELDKAQNSPDYKYSEMAPTLEYKYAPSLELSSVERVILTYTLKSGKTITRRYYVPVTEELLGDPSSPAGALNAILNDRSKIVEQLTLPDGVVFTEGFIDSEYFIDEETNFFIQLDGAQAQRIYDALQSDLRTSSAGRVWMLRGEDYYKNSVRASVHISAKLPIGFNDYGDPIYDRFSIYFVPTVDSRNVLNVLASIEGVDERLLEPWIK